MKTLVLTARDIALLAFIALHREVDVVEIARAFFASARSTVTGGRTKNPEKQCMRRLAKLRAHGYVDLARVNDGTRRRTVVTLMARANQPLNERASGRTLHQKERVHHLRTLDAVRILEADIKARGGRVVSIETETALRARTLRGRRTRRGDSFASFPDAVCVAVVATPSGPREVKIAVEYVTSKYTDADIRAKHDSFRTTYDDAVWFGDKPRTASRVRNITGVSCSILS